MIQKYAARFITGAIITMTMAGNLAMGATPSTLDSLPAIKAIANEEAMGQEVDFLATVTYRDTLWNFLFVQQDDLAIFVNARNVETLSFGQTVRIQGKLIAGDMLPIVVADRVTEIGRSDPPEPIEVNLGTLPIGTHDGRLAVMEGEVLQVHVESQHTLLACRTFDDGQSEFWVKVGHGDEVFRVVNFLPGRRVRFVGTLGVYFKKHEYVTGARIGHREILGFHVFCHSPSSVTMIDHEPAESVAVRTVDLAELESEEFADGPFSTHGQVSLVADNDGAAEMVLFDDFNAVRIQLVCSFGVREGTVFRVAGIKTRAWDGSTIYKANFLRQLNVEMLLPAPVQTFDESIAQFDENNRVTIEGRPIRVVKDSLSQRTYIELGSPLGQSETIDVRLQNDAIESLAFANPSLAKTISVTGVMASKGLRKDSSSAYELIVSSADDVKLIERHAEYWRLIGGVLIGLLSAAALGAIWSRILKFQVDRKTKAVRGVATQLRYSYDAIDEGVLVIDSEGVVLAVNDEFRRLAGLKVQFGEVVGNLPEHLLHRLKKPAEFRLQWETWLADQSSTGELEIELDSQDPLHVVVSSSPVRGVDSDHPMGRIMMWRDETERRRLQHELLHRNKLEAVGRLVAGVAHDFNNVLAAITGNLSVVRLKQESVVRDVDRELEVAEEAAFRGADVIRRLLSYSSKSKFDLRPQPVNAIIHRLSQLVRHTFDVSITFVYDLDPADLFINAESTAIEQVILNLYVNARDAMPGGGTIRTSTQVVKGKDGAADMVLISVEDSGVGVLDEHVDRIFEPFFTTKGREQGTGIGLSISYRVVQQHDGLLRYRKPDKGGSEFQILLPRVAQCEENVLVHSDPIEAGSGTVLVVDDEDDVRQVAVNILQSQGFRTLSACGGAEAIEVLANEAVAIDAVLLDVTMPGMSGREVLQQIRNRWSRIPVVLCSGYIVSDSIEADSEIGPDATLAKPYSVGDLVNVISNVIRGKVAN